MLLFAFGLFRRSFSSSQSINFYSFIQYLFEENQMDASMPIPKSKLDAWWVHDRQTRPTSFHNYWDESFWRHRGNRIEPHERLAVLISDIHQQTTHENSSPIMTQFCGPSTRTFDVCRHIESFTNIWVWVANCDSIPTLIPWLGYVADGIPNKLQFIKEKNVDLYENNNNNATMGCTCTFIFHSAATSNRVPIPSNTPLFG